MLRAACPKLSAIAKQLHGKYDLHFAMIARNAPEAELRSAEAEASRISRVMRNHLRKCPKCTPAFPGVTVIRRRPLILDVAS
jgi:hypothetical protein